MDLVQIWALPTTWFLRFSKYRAVTGGRWDTCSAKYWEYDPSGCFHMHANVSPMMGLNGFLTPCVLKWNPEMNHRAMAFMRAYGVGCFGMLHKVEGEQQREKKREQTHQHTA